MVDPLCQSRERCPSVEGALQEAEQKKLSTYGSGWEKNHPDRPITPFAISSYGQLGPRATALVAHLKDRARKNRTPFPARWFMAVLASTAIQGSVAIRDAWFAAFSGGLCAHSSSFVRGASSGRTDKWDSDEVSEKVSFEDASTFVGPILDHLDLR